MFYVETVHGSLNNYPWIVRELSQDLLALPRLQTVLVFWPIDAAEEPEQLTAEAIQASPARLEAALAHRASSGPPKGAFEAGLAKAARLAAAANAPLVLLFDSAASDLTREQIAAIKQVSSAQRVIVVAVDHSVDEFRPLASGLVISVSYGALPIKPPTSQP